MQSVLYITHVHVGRMYRLVHEYATVHQTVNSGLQ